MDLVDFDSKDYIDYHAMRIDRDLLNASAKFNEAVLLRDKRLFGLYMGACGLPTPEVLGMLRVDGAGAKHYFEANLAHELDVMTVSYPLFLKGLRGECADEIHRIASSDELLSMYLPCGDYLLQAEVRQHEDMFKMGPNSVNTCRIVTVLYDGRAQLFSAVLRCGTEKAGCVDNWAAGGIAVGVNPDGSLAKEGFYKPGKGLIATEHPDTGVKFNEFVIPFYQDAVDAALRAQQAFPECPCIGWDVAITVDGPIFIEGNDNWEISLMQVCNGGMKKQWNEFVSHCGL